MNRLFTILCMVSLLVFHTSCNDSVMDLESPNVEIKTRAVDQRVQNLIQQARQGDVEAYNSLALCYRDGDGVDKSWLNMICMYATYSQKTGGDIEDVIGLFDEGHPFRLLFEIMDSPSFNEEVEAKLEQLKQSAPAEAKAIEARKYGETEDFSYIQKAIECYYKADAHGMLIPKYANALWGMYDYFGQKGMLEYDEQEVERLKVLAKRTY